MTAAATSTLDSLGRVGLPAPIAELAAREWDAIVVGGGHNGLAAAAYLARAGRSVLVLERREQLGGACALERPFPDPAFVVSPCAYVVGLLDRRLIDELGLRAHGYSVELAEPSLWCGFADGSSYAEFLDPGRQRAHLEANRFSAREIDGVGRYYDVYGRARARLRAGPAGDTWVGSAPSRARIEEILDEEELIDLVFSSSVADVLERYLEDPRLHQALWGQGVIGTWAGPRTAGTAMVKLMHSMGAIEGEPSAWGYVRGGMGAISFAIADAAREAGATLAAGVPVARIETGEGIELESGELIRARAVLCNADPKRLLGMLDSEQAQSVFGQRLRDWEVGSPVVKLNAALSRTPRFSAATAAGPEPQRAMVTVAPGIDEGQAAYEASRRGQVRIGFCELYFQTAYDPSVAPDGKQTLSVFAQYAPYELADGGWETQRERIGDAIIETIAGAAPEIGECLLFREVLGPPDIEERVGLSGGHIFQGEVLPEQMWDRRLDHRTPIEGLYLCGAATHPGGSVIGLNGRNAAAALLADSDGPALDGAASGRAR
jgi:phytoene dehydrogenase-like protein